MLRALIVDDEYSMRLVARHFFDHCGYDFVTDEAKSGEEAIALLDQHTYDLVLSDHRMGAVTGLDVLKHAKERHPDVLRFMMTGYADPRLAAAAVDEADVHGFIEKPSGLEATRKVFQRVVLDPYLNRLARV